MSVILAGGAGGFAVTGEAVMGSLFQPNASGGFAVLGNALCNKEWNGGASAGISIYGAVQNALVPARLKAVSQQAVTDPLVTLYALDLSRFGSGMLRFTPDSGPDGSGVSFGGHLYVPHPVRVEGFGRNVQGQFARPRMVVSNINSAFSALIIGGKDLVGCELTRIRTFARFLDNGDQPDPNQHFPLEIYRIERKTAHNNLFVEWELASAIDVEGTLLPRRQILRQYCDAAYRVWDPERGEWWHLGRPACPYSGAAMFTDTGDPTDNPAQDRCAKRLSSCELRYGKAPLPFRGFPGADEIR